jgi:hypothetical protein
MKTKFVLTGILGMALLAMAAPRTWTFKQGGTFEGDYISSGTSAVVVRKDGTNYTFNIANLSTNDQAYVGKMQTAQKQARLDAEAKQMQQAGMIEFTSDLIQSFPDKVRLKNGWMDAEFVGFNTTGGRNNEMDLGFWVKDSQGKYFHECCVSRQIYGPNPLDEPKPNPFVDVISNLKAGDKVRFFGHVDDPRTHAFGDYTYHFFVDRIEMIEKAAEKKAREQATENP